MVSVLFVCLGNICRSPTAQGVFHAHCERAGVGQSIKVDSAGTGDWHRGESPDSRAQAAARQRGIDLSAQRARQVVADDFRTFDYVLAMDSSNLRDLTQIQPAGAQCVLERFLTFAPGVSLEDVPDPYYGGDRGFEEVLDLVEAASEGLLAHIRAAHKGFAN